MKEHEEDAIEFPSLSADDWNEVGTTMLSLHFMDTVKKCFPKPFKKKALAEAIGCSAAYASQLCRGDRLLNVRTLQAIQRAQKVNFDLVIRYDVGNPNFPQQTLTLTGSQFIHTPEEREIPAYA